MAILDKCGLQIAKYFCINAAEILNEILFQMFIRTEDQKVLTICNLKYCYLYVIPQSENTNTYHVGRNPLTHVCGGDVSGQFARCLKALIALLTMERLLTNMNSLM